MEMFAIASIVPIPVPMNSFLYEELPMITVRTMIDRDDQSTAIPVRRQWSSAPCGLRAVSSPAPIGCSALRDQALAFIAFVMLGLRPKHPVCQ